MPHRGKLEAGTISTERIFHCHDPYCHLVRWAVLSVSPRGPAACPGSLVVGPAEEFPQGSGFAARSTGADPAAPCPAPPRPLPPSKMGLTKHQGRSVPSSLVPALFAASPTPGGPQQGPGGPVLLPCVCKEHLPHLTPHPRFSSQALILFWRLVKSSLFPCSNTSLESCYGEQACSSP